MRLIHSGRTVQVSSLPKPGTPVSPYAASTRAILDARRAFDQGFEIGQRIVDVCACDDREKILAWPQHQRRAPIDALEGGALVVRRFAKRFLVRLKILGGFGRRQLVLMERERGRIGCRRE